MTPAQPRRTSRGGSATQVLVQTINLDKTFEVAPTPTPTSTLTPVPPLPTLSGERGTAVLTEVIGTGTSKAISGLVTFVIPQPDTNYTATFVSTDVLCSGQTVTEKTTTGFRAVCGGSFASATIDWVIVR